MSDTKTITDAIDNDYKLYANYTLSNRAIPSFIDGFKPVHRKLLYAMIHEHKGKRTKISDLGGISKFNYNHGESSAMGAAITLAADWNNNIPIFQQHGSFGSRLVPAAAAPRYIYAGLSEEFKNYFTDFDVLDFADDDNPEPINYLPNIPWILVNGIEGIAVGHACKYLPHSPAALAKACKLAIAGKLKDNTVIKPSFPGFFGEIEIESHNKYTTYGIAERTKRNVWEIQELPFGVTREKYFDILKKLEDSGKIQDFEDNCSNRFKFTVKLTTKQDEECSKDPIAYFKLSKAFTENYTALDETGNLILFDTKVQIIKRFVEYRINKIQDQFDFDINKIDIELVWLNAKLSFVKDVLADKINFKKTTRKDLTLYCEKQYSISKELSTRLVNISIVDITIDEVKKLEDKIKEHTDNRQLISEKVPADEMVARLNTIIKSK